MASLATVEQLEARVGSLPDTTRAQALLDDASAAVRAYCGIGFEAVTGGTATLRVPASGLITLPEWPVTDVTAVTTLDATAVTFVWEHGTDLIVTTSETWVVVTYDYGFATIPAEIVAVVCQIAGRSYGVNLLDSGYTQDTAGPFSRTVGSAAASGAVGMMPAERTILDRYRVGAYGASIMVGTWA